MRKVHEFFSVTVSGSVYRITDHIDQGCPIVEKLSQGEGSRLPVGTRLDGGNYVALTHDMGTALFRFIGLPDLEMMWKAVDLDRIPLYVCGGRTSATVGYFLDEGDARRAVLQPHLLAFDSRWHGETREALLRVKDHNIFRISKVLYDLFIPLTIS